MKNFLLFFFLFVGLMPPVLAENGWNIRKIAGYCDIWRGKALPEREIARVEKLAEKSLSTTPGDWGALLCKKQILEKRNDFNSLLEVGAQLEKIAQNEDEKIVVWLTYVNAYYGLGNEAEAGRYYEMAAPRLRAIGKAILER